MRLLGCTDLHGNSRACEKVRLASREFNVDGVVIAGDVTNFGTIFQAQQLLGKISGEDEMLVYFVPGNCDPQELLQFTGFPPSVINLHGVVYESSKIFCGLGGSNPTPFNTSCEFSEGDIAGILSKFPNNVDLFVSHAPPKGTPLDIPSRGAHVGSIAVRDFIESNSPQVSLSGHIHEASGVAQLNETIIVNPGPGGMCLIDLDLSPPSVELL